MYKWFDKPAVQVVVSLVFTRAAETTMRAYKDLAGCGQTELVKEDD